MVARKTKAATAQVLSEVEDNEVTELTTPTVTKINFGVPSGTVYGKNVTDLGTNLAVDENGKVTGALKFVSGYTGFHGTNKDEQYGFFVPFTVSFPKTVTKATMRVSGGSGKLVSILGEEYNVVRVGSSFDKAIAKSVEINYVDGNDFKTACIDLSELTLAEVTDSFTEVTLTGTLKGLNYLVYLPSGIVEFKAGKAKVNTSNKAILTAMGLI